MAAAGGEGLEMLVEALRAISGEHSGVVGEEGVFLGIARAGSDRRIDRAAPAWLRHAPGRPQRVPGEAQLAV